MHRHITKTRVVSLVLVALAVGGVIAVVAATAQGTTSGYRTATVEHRTIAETLDEVGTIEPAKYAEVAFPAAGTVATVEARPGDSVTAGQVLATLDQASLEATIREARAALDQAELTLQTATSSSATATPDGTSTAPESSGSPSPGGATGSALPSTGATTSAATPSSERLIAYNAAIDAAAADLVVAEAALRQATIVSPIDGTVVSVDIAAGDEVSAASDTATVGIDGGGGVEVTAIVGVDDLPDLEIGQAATVAPDGMDTTFEGEVVSIGLTSSSDDGSSTYPVTISIDGDVDGLRHGSVASVAIVLATGDNVLAVPTSALRADGGEHRVRVLTNGTVEDAAVEVGAIGSDWIEIRNGLAAGDVIVLADLDQPLPGSATEGGSGAGGIQGGGFGPGFGGPAGN